MYHNDSMGIGLDRYNTGHYGEDQIIDVPDEDIHALYEAMLRASEEAISDSSVVMTDELAAILVEARACIVEALHDEQDDGALISALAAHGFFAALLEAREDAEMSAMVARDEARQASRWEVS